MPFLRLVFYGSIRLIDLYSGDRRPTRRIDNGSIWPQVHHSARRYHLCHWRNTAGFCTESIHDLGWQDTGRLGCGIDVDVGAGLSSRICRSTISRLDCWAITTDDWYWLHCQHVCSSIPPHPPFIADKVRWIGYGSLHASDSSQFQWRFPLAFQVVPALTLVIGMIFLPESPRYLIEKGKFSEAMQVLRKMHANGTNEDWLEAEYTGICRTIEAEKAIAMPGWMPMFTVPQWRTRMLYVSTNSSAFLFSL